MQVDIRTWVEHASRFWEEGGAASRYKEEGGAASSYKEMGGACK